MTEPRAAAAVFQARVDRLGEVFHASCGVGDPAGERPDPDLRETGSFASYDDARAWVHLSAGQAGFRTICWDTDSYAAPEEASAG